MAAAGRSALVAIGGNALAQADAADGASIASQMQAASAIGVQLARVVAAGWNLVITHGNGPQVGSILRRSELAAELARDLPPAPLDVCVADSQGVLGYILSTALRNELHRANLPIEVVSVIAHTTVDGDDAAFRHPSKPIGHFYSKEAATLLGTGGSGLFVQDSGRGYRRVVPSPEPRGIVECNAIRALFEAGFIVITAGGGGIPILDESGEQRGVAAVVDKDLVSALLASELRIHVLVLTTAIDRVALDFGKPTQRFLDRMTQDEARRYLNDGQFPPGSMGPKIQAALRFLNSGVREAVVTSPSNLESAFRHSGGTRIVS